MLQASGASLELEIVRHGHYDEGRSENKGVEPEGVAVGTVRRQDLAFVGAERANSVAVYEVGRQLVVPPAPAHRRRARGSAPHPQAQLVRHRQRGRRHAVDLPLRPGPATYPTIVSVDSGTSGAVPGSTSPIPWGALSALAADPKVPGRLYTVHDNAYANTRIYTVDASKKPAAIIKAIDVRGGINRGLGRRRARHPARPGRRRLLAGQRGLERRGDP